MQQILSAGTTFYAIRINAFVILCNYVEYFSQSCHLIVHILPELWVVALCTADKTVLSTLLWCKHVMFTINWQCVAPLWQHAQYRCLVLHMAASLRRLKMSVFPDDRYSRITIQLPTHTTENLKSLFSYDLTKCTFFADIPYRRMQNFLICSHMATLLAITH